MAEAVFKSIVKDRNLDIQVDSAGTASYHVGDPPDSRSVKECNRNNVAVHHRARQIQEKDFSEFDYILVMDEDNLQDVKRMQPKSTNAIVQLFGNYGESKVDRIIKDPYYGGNDGFTKNFEQCVRCSHGLLKQLRL
jgi:low molecular weight phosphotyrosine protein phosphatase